MTKIMPMVSNRVALFVASAAGAPHLERDPLKDNFASRST